MASVASQLIEEVTAHAQSDSLEDAREICADGTYFPNNLRIFMAVYFVDRLGDEEVKAHYCLVGCDPVYIASSLQVSIILRTFLIRGCSIATTILFFLKIPLFEMLFCFFFIWSSRKCVCVCVCVCVCRTFVSKYSLS